MDLEAHTAGVLIGVAQHALAQAEEVAGWGSKNPDRPATRRAIERAITAANDAQRLVTAELERDRRVA